MDNYYWDLKYGLIVIYCKLFVGRNEVWLQMQQQSMISLRELLMRISPFDKGNIQIMGGPGMDGRGEGETTTLIHFEVLFAHKIAFLMHFWDG